MLSYCFRNLIGSSFRHEHEEASFYRALRVRTDIEKIPKRLLPKADTACVSITHGQ